MELTDNFKKYFPTKEEKLNEEHTVKEVKPPTGLLADYLNGVVQRTIHPLEAASNAVKKFQSLPIEEQAMNLMGPVGGIAGTFIGELSPVFNQASKKLALQFETTARQGGYSKGSVAQKIKNVLNLHRGVSELNVKNSSNYGLGEWRQEISDIPMKVNIPRTKIEVFGRNAYKDNLIDVVDHPELKKAYPSLLENYDFILHEHQYTKGAQHTLPSYTKDENGIKKLLAKGKIEVFKTKEEIEAFKANNYDITQTIKSHILHEVQHAIQYKEGWPVGASYNKIRTELAKEKRYVDMFRKDSSLAKATLDRESYQKYLKVAGENEARLTQARIDMDEEMRKIFHPYDMTSDIKEEGIKLFPPNQQTVDRHAERSINILNTSAIK